MSGNNLIKKFTKKHCRIIYMLRCREVRMSLSYYLKAQLRAVAGFYLHKMEEGRARKIHIINPIARCILTDY